MSKNKEISIAPYISDLENLSKNSKKICGFALYEGAAVMADEISARISSLPEYTSKTENPKGATAYEKKLLKDRLGISGVKTSNGVYYSVVGFAGYDGRITEAYPNGHPVSMIVRSIEGGTSWLTKSPFVKPAYNAKKETAAKKMSAEVDNQIKEILN